MRSHPAPTSPRALDQRIVDFAQMPAPINSTVIGMLFQTELHHDAVGIVDQLRELARRGNRPSMPGRQQRKTLLQLSTSSEVALLVKGDEGIRGDDRGKKQGIRVRVQEHGRGCARRLRTAGK